MSGVIDEGLVRRMFYAVAEVYQVDPEGAISMEGRKGSLMFSDVRAAVAIALRRQGYGLTDIGEALHRDHSTVHYTVTNGGRRLATDTQLRRAVEVALAEVHPLSSTPPSTAKAFRNRLRLMEEIAESAIRSGSEAVGKGEALRDQVRALLAFAEQELEPIPHRSGAAS